MKKLFKFIALTSLLVITNAGDVKDSAQIKGAAPQPSGPLVIDMSAKAWDLKYGNGMGAHPKTWGTGWSFQFPTKPGVVGYVVQSTTGFIPVCTPNSTTTLEAIIDVVATPGTVFDYHTNPDNTGNMPSAARFYVENEWSNGDYVRWWATGNNCVVLTNGSFVYSVPIDPSQWSDTWGRRGDSSPEAIAGFNAAFANVRRIGFTFGGGSFYGHGVWLLSGSASFNVSNVQIRTVSIP